MQYQRRSALFWGTVLILLGVLFIAQKIKGFELGDLIVRYWPVTIIISGLYIIIMNFSRKGESAPWQQKHFGDRSLLTDRDTVLQSNTFGDVKLTIDSRDFQGGTVKTTFGDVKVDLTTADIKSGEKMLQLTTVFGDIQASLPGKLPVSVRASNTAGDMNIFGNKKGGLGRTLYYKSEGYDQAVNKLAITISQVFGDVKVW